MSNDNENKIVPDEQAAEAISDALPEATEKAVEADAYKPDPLRAASHLVGISTPEDEHHDSYTDKARDQLSDAELLAMGIEPDSGPTRNMIWTFAALVVVIIGVGVAVAQLYNVVNTRIVDQANARVDRRLAELAAADQAVIGVFERLEPTEEQPQTTYRVPVEQGMDILLADPSLLARHPLAPEPEPEPVAPTEQPEMMAPEGSGAGEPAADTANAGDEAGDAPTTDTDPQ